MTARTVKHTTTRKPARRATTTAKRRPARRRGNPITRPFKRVAQRTKNRIKRTTKRRALKVLRWLGRSTKTGLVLLGKGAKRTGAAIRRRYATRNMAKPTRGFCPSCNRHGQGHGGHCAAKGT